MERSNHNGRLIVTIVIIARILIAAVFVWARKAAREILIHSIEGREHKGEHNDKHCYYHEQQYHRISHR